MLVTPRNKSVFICLIGFLYLTSPFVEGYRLYNDLLAGAYDPHRDSFGLPMTLFLIAWFAGLPFIIGFMVWAWFRYSPGASLFGFNPERFGWSVLWTLIFGYLFFDTLLITVINIDTFYPAEIFQNLLVAYMFLVIRAIFVFQGLNAK